VQRVDHGKAALLVFRVAGWKEDDNIAIDDVALQVFLKSGAMDLDVLDRDRLCVRHNVGHVGLHLPS